MCAQVHVSERQRGLLKRYIAAGTYQNRVYPVKYRVYSESSGAALGLIVLPIAHVSADQSSALRICVGLSRVNRDLQLLNPPYLDWT